MKLVKLVKYLKDDESLDEFYRDYKYKKDEENVILVYMKDQLDLNSELFFFTEKQTGDIQVFEKEGAIYHSLFSLGLGVEFYSYFDQFFASQNYSDQQKAQRLLEYVINDA